MERDDITRTSIEKPERHFSFLFPVADLGLRDFLDGLQKWLGMPSFHILVNICLYDSSSSSSYSYSSFHLRLISFLLVPTSRKPYPLPVFQLEPFTRAATPP